MDTTCKIVIVEGTPLSGKTTLATALARDLGLPLRSGTRGWLDEAGPFVADEFHLDQAVRMEQGLTDLTATAWQLLDDLVARRFGRIILLVDTPAAIEARVARMGESWVRSREGAGKHLKALNRAYNASSVARKGSYRLPQFIDVKTGEKTEMYRRLLAIIRREMRLED